MGRQVFTAGEILTAASMNDLGDQTVMVFDDDAARATAIPTPVEGMLTYLEDVGGAQGLEVFDGSVFTPVAIEPDPPAILQVVSTAKTDVFTTASNTFTNITGLSVTITPSAASSKMLILAQISIGHPSGGIGTFRINGGNASNYVGDAVGSRQSGVFGGSVDSNLTQLTGSLGINFLDSPATTSTITYSAQVSIPTGTVFVNRSSNDGNNNSNLRGSSSLIVMEVAG